MHAPVLSAHDPSRFPGHPQPARRRIGLVVDHPLRDLDGLCLVAQLLAARGHEAVLLPFYTQHFDLPNVALDAIVLNYARPANRALVEAAAARGIALVVLDTEGGLLPDTGPTSPAGIAAYLSSSGLDRALALYLFWGEHLRDCVVEGTALAPERAIVTGCPRFDLAPASTTQDSARGYGQGQGQGQGHVLVNTNFPIANAARVQGTRVDGEALRSVGFSERQIAELVESVEHVMQRMIETVRAIAIARPDTQFVIRPHPFERTQPYEAAFGACSNVRIERVGTAMEALAGASCLLHVNCTTAIEACLVQVPPISLDFINEPMLKAMAQLPGEVSHPAQSLDEALALIDRAANLEPGRLHARITPFFGPLDGGAAHRVVDALAGLPLPRPAPDFAPAPRLRFRLAALLGRVLGSRVIESERRLRDPSRRLKAFGPDAVAMRLDRIARAQGQNPAEVSAVRTLLGAQTLALRITPATLHE